MYQNINVHQAVYGLGHLPPVRPPLLRAVQAREIAGGSVCLTGQGRDGTETVHRTVESFDAWVEKQVARGIADGRGVSA